MKVSMVIDGLYKIWKHGFRRWKMRALTIKMSIAYSSKKKRPVMNLQVLRVTR